MSVSYEGNIFIDGGKAQNIELTSSSVNSCIITTSSLDMNFANITSVADPINDYDAANKRYVDFLGIIISTITLTNTDLTLISSNQSGSFIITVTNLILNGPSGIFHVTKNNATRQAQINRTNSCPGYSTDISLHIDWPINDGIYLYKSGNNYNGSYKIKLL